MASGNSNKWIIVIATLALIGLGAIQANWINRAHQLKSDQIDLQLVKLSPTVAKILHIRKLIAGGKKLDGQVEFDLHAIEELIDSISMLQMNSNDVHFAIYRNGSNPIFRTTNPKSESDLRMSKYQTCLSCIVTIIYYTDTIESEKPESVFLRSVEEYERLPGSKSREEYLYLSLFVPTQKLLSWKSMGGLLVVALCLSLLLLYIFWSITKALTRQKKISQTKNDFINNLTHEFKTPLSSIRLATRMLKQDPLSDRRETYLNLIENESRRLEGQVDTILQLSLLDAKGISLQTEIVNLHAATEEAIHRLQLIMEQTNGQIKLSLGSPDPFVNGDYEHLSNCIYHVVENALKYAGPDPRIEIMSQLGNGMNRLIIRDEGPGIPMDKQDEIFDRFFRVQKNDQYKGKGFGIGLSYVKQIVEAHQGTILLNSNCKNGCEFIMEFPRFVKSKIDRNA